MAELKPLNQGRQFTTDPVDALRTGALVESDDVGTTMGQYLGTEDYTFKQEDVGRMIEVVQNMSPGFMSWYFGSIFSDLREKYPDPIPYIGAPSATE